MKAVENLTFIAYFKKENLRIYSHSLDKDLKKELKILVL